jgi:hypothetical protein
MRVDWRGVFPAVTTQFADDGSVDLAATSAQLEPMIAASIGGLIMLVAERRRLRHLVQQMRSTMDDLS